MNEFKTQIEKERTIIKKSMYGNHIMKFEANKTATDEEILGKLINLKFYCTVIILIYFKFF
jgi:hypothetical protein